MSLYSLINDYQEFLEAVEAGEIPEEAITDTLEAIEGEIEVKIDNIASAIKNLTAEASMIRAEEKALAERRKRKENLTERLRGYLGNELQRLGIDKHETARHNLRFTTSTGVTISNEAGLIEWALESAPDAIKTEYKPSLTALKDLINNGIEVPFATVEKRRNLQIK